LMWMRTESIKRSCNLRVSFTPATWNYTIFRTAATCDCPAGGNCNDVVVNGSEFIGITMSSAAYGAGTATRFDFRRGTAVIAGNTQFDSTNYHVKVVVAPVGRVRICNIAGQNGLGSYENC